MASPDAQPPLAERGTSAYFPSLLTRIATVHPGLPLDSVVLQSVLLCLIARVDAPALSTHTTAGLGWEDSAPARGEAWTCANLILRTREEDVALLVHLVSLMVTTVFGISTHKHKIPTQKVASCKNRPRPGRMGTGESPDTFLRSLFFRRPSSSVRRSADMSARGATRPPHSPAAAHRSLSQTPRPSPLRLSRSMERESTDDNSTDHFIDGVSLASSRRPLISASSPASTLRSRRFQADRLLFLDEMSVPSPVLSDREVVPEAGTGENDTDDVQPLPVLPKAVVVSGLEHASLPAQRALCLALAERRLIFEEEMASANSCLNEEGTWNLPDDFIMIYVCKADGHDRPALLGALLDKFAMSTDVVISPAVRHAYAAYRGTPSSTPLASPFATPHSLPTPSDVTSSGPLRSPPSRFFALPSMSTSKPISPPVPPAELALLRASSARTVMHPFLSAYLRNLFYAARQHPLLDGTLLTRRTHRDADALVRAFRVIAGDSVGADLLRAGFAGGLPGEASEHASTTSLSTREPAEWEKGVTGIDWARRGDGASDREAICGNGATDEPMPVNLPFRMPASEDEVDPDDKTSMLGDTNEVAVWDVSEVDVARVFPRIVSHHLRVRGGPDEEILGSINWPAVEHLPDGGPNPRLDGSVYERKTVKEVLVQILGDV